MPFAATLDTRIGEEIVLVIADHTPFLFDLASLDPFNIHLKAGAVNTESGPVIFLLFSAELVQIRSRKVSVLICARKVVYFFTHPYDN